jgi:hypothetical protein
MSNIDPLIAEILLKGDDEFLSKLKNVGEQAESSFQKMEAAVAANASSFSLAAMGLGLVATAITGTIAATTNFIEQQTALSQSTELLANSFGSSAGQLQELEAIFASSGVKVEQFERFATRLTTTIARQWPQIAESIKMYATENDAATLHVSEAILHVRDAQNALGDNSAQRASQMEHDNEALEASYLKLQFAAQHAASEQQAAHLSVQGAVLSEEAALQHLNEVQGNPPTAGEKQALKEEQAIQALTQARKATADARLAEQEKAANAALKQKQMEQENEDLRRKAAKNAREDAEQFVKDQNAVKSAIIARAEAEEKADKLALTSVSSIRDALHIVETGSKTATTAIDLSRVSVDNLVKGMIALAAETSKTGKPSGWEALSTISKTLAADNERVKAGLQPLIDKQDRLAIVTRLAGTSMQALGKSASEILDVLENSSIKIEELKNHADRLAAIDPQGIRDFRAALYRLNFEVGLLNQTFASWATPAFTAFLNMVKDSLIEDSGAIHLFIDGVKGMATTVGNMAKEVGKAFTWVSEQVNEFSKRLGGNNLISPIEMIRAAWIGIGVAIVAALGPIGEVIVAIVAVTLAVGYLRDHWTEVTEFVEKHKAAIIGIGVTVGILIAVFAPMVIIYGVLGAAVVLIAQHWDEVYAAVGRAWEAVKDTGVYKFLDGVITRLKEMYDWLSKTKTTPNNPDKGSNAGTGTEAAVSKASGGMIEGPGSTTSDSILARLSRGEYVIKAAAVQNYGAGLFHALNNMVLPGFAAGGLVPSPIRMSGGGSVPATSTVNLSIDGRSFGSLRGSKSTVDDLSSFAIARQTSAAGSNPSWMK